MGVGGSIPFIAEFLEAFPEASVLVTGVEDPDTRAHGANEGLHLAEFERVVLAEALLLRNLGALPRRRPPTGRLEAPGAGRRLRPWPTPPRTRKGGDGRLTAASTPTTRAPRTPAASSVSGRPARTSPS